MTPTSFAKASSGGSTVNSADKDTSSAFEPAKTSVATETAVFDFSNNVLGVPLTRNDISIAHRLPKRPTDSKPAAIIVRFTNRRARDAVYNARKALKRRNLNVYVNEHLIKSRSVVLGEAKKLVKAKKLDQQWSRLHSALRTA